MAQLDNAQAIVEQLKKQFWSQIKINSSQRNCDSIVLTRLKASEFKKLMLTRRVNSVQISFEFSDTLKLWLDENYSDIDSDTLSRAILYSLNKETDDKIIKQFIKRLNFCLNSPSSAQDVIMGLEPNLKSGVKLVIINTKSDAIAHTVIFPHEPQNQRTQALRKLSKLCDMYHVKLISIGTGDAAQETEQLIQELINNNQNSQLRYIRYYDNAASLVENNTSLDPSFSNALSVARRLQNPTIELLKAKLKYIDFDFSQQEVDQQRLSRAISKTVASVNAQLIDSDPYFSPFNPTIEKLSDLTVGQKVEGVVSSVRNFGLFVNVGIAQHGLVHISEIKKGYINDPNDFVIVGEQITVWVKSIDEKNSQFSISCINPNKSTHNNKKKSSPVRKPHHSKSSSKPVANSAFADAMAKALDKN